MLSGNRPEVLANLAAMQIAGCCGTTLHPLGSLDDHAYVLTDAGIETLAGRIVLNIASTRTDDDELFAGLDDDERAAAIERLGALHFAKIDLADEILVLNVGGYIGASTRAEIDYAHRTGTLVRYLEPPGPSQA